MAILICYAPANSRLNTTRPIGVTDPYVAPSKTLTTYCQLAEIDDRLIYELVMPQCQDVIYSPPEAQDL